MNDYQKTCPLGEPEKLKGSIGFKPQKPGYTDISCVPDHAKQLYEKVQPHYDHLYQYRLTP